MRETVSIYSNCHPAAAGCLLATDGLAVLFELLRLQRMSGRPVRVRDRSRCHTRHCTERFWRDPADLPEVLCIFVRRWQARSPFGFADVKMCEEVLSADHRRNSGLWARQLRGPSKENCV